MEFRKAAVLGATGPTGRRLAAELSRRGLAVRVVARERAHLDRKFDTPDVERVVADLRDPEQARRAVDGCDVVFDCIGVPMTELADHPLTARRIADAVRSAGACCVHISSYWAYLPIERTPLNESHPRSGGNEAVRLRREAEDILLEVEAAVVNLPDFYGPLVHASTLQQALREAQAGQTVRWIGAATTQREYVYVPDAMRKVAELSLHEAAYGTRWIVPGAGPISIEQVAAIAGRHLGRRVRIRAAGLMTLRLLSPFVGSLRAFMPMARTYTHPISHDGAKLRSLIGDAVGVDYDEGIPATLDWLAERTSS